jgi:hypothetical protein
MDSDLLKTLGEILGIGGLALGAFFLLFREVLRKSIFPMLKKDDAYRLLRWMAVLIWSVAGIGIGAWVWGERNAAAITTTAPQTPIIQNTKGDVRIEFDAPEQPRRP